MSNTRHHHARRGISRTGVIVTIICIIVLLVIVIVPVYHAMTLASEGASILKDGTQAKQVHEAWVIFSRHSDGRFPTPGRFGGKNDEPGYILRELDDASIPSASCRTTTRLRSV